MVKEKKIKSKKTKSITGLKLSTEQLKLAKEVFSVKYPGIEFDLKGYLVNKIQEDANNFGLVEGSFYTSYGKITSSFRNFESLAAAFVRTINQGLIAAEAVKNKDQYFINEQKKNAQAIAAENLSVTVDEEKLSEALGELDKIDLAEFNA